MFIADGFFRKLHQLFREHPAATSLCKLFERLKICFIERPIVPYLSYAILLTKVLSWFRYIFFMALFCFFFFVFFLQAKSFCHFLRSIQISIVTESSFAIPKITNLKTFVVSATLGVDTLKWIFSCVGLHGRKIILVRVCSVGFGYESLKYFNLIKNL